MNELVVKYLTGSRSELARVAEVRVNYEDLGTALFTEAVRKIRQEGLFRSPVWYIPPAAIIEVREICVSDISPQIPLLAS